MGNLHNYVKLYNKILDDQTCDDFLSVMNNSEFENVENENYKFKQTIVTDDSRWRYEGIEVLENESSPLHIQDIFSGLFFAAATNYFQDTQVPLVPELEGFENIRIKKFEDDSFYRLHSDVNDYKSAKRFLSVMIFLQDTENCFISFPNLSNIELKPQKGSVLVFPPHWLFPYEINCQKNASMLYAHSYLHYI